MIFLEEIAGINFIVKILFQFKCPFECHIKLRITFQLSLLQRIAELIIDNYSLHLRYLTDKNFCLFK